MRVLATLLPAKRELIHWSRSEPAISLVKSNSGGIGALFIFTVFPSYPTFAASAFFQSGWRGRESNENWARPRAPSRLLGHQKPSGVDLE